MTDDITPAEESPVAESNTDAQNEENAEEKRPTSIFLVSYPKIVFMYPTLIVALVAGVYMAIAGNEPPEDRHDTEILALVFLATMSVNMAVLAFDFPRTTSLTLFFFFSAVVMGIVLWAQFQPDLLSFFTRILYKLSPWANSTFYFLIAAMLCLIFAAVAINVQFDYWEVRPNELLHHHGIMSDLERFSAPSLRIDKEINDVFEYLLLRSGRLILHPSNERRAIVLENVFFISRKEREITKMLGALQVQVRSNTH